MSMMISWLLLGVVVVLGIISEGRYRRVKRRLRRIEQRVRVERSELLPVIRAGYARAMDMGDGSEPTMFRAEMGEDMLLLELLGREHEGLFVEVGGYDGMTNSATFALEQLGWRGLLIEPVASLCEKARDIRPHAIVVNAAVSRRGSAGEAEFIYFPVDADGSRADLASRLGSASAVESSRPRNEGKVTRVRLTTIADELRAHYPQRQLDLVIIDVEGAELDALDGLEIEHTGPRIVMVENHDHRAQISETMERYGYLVLFRLDFNYFFARASDEVLFDRCRRLGLDQVGIS